MAFFLFFFWLFFFPQEAATFACSAAVPGHLQGTDGCKILQGGETAAGCRAGARWLHPSTAASPNSLPGSYQGSTPAGGMEGGKAISQATEREAVCKAALACLHGEGCIKSPSITSGMKAALRYGAQHCCPQALGKKEPRGGTGIAAAVWCDGGHGVPGTPRPQAAPLAHSPGGAAGGDSPLLPPGLPAGRVLFSLNTASFSHYKSRRGYFP